MKSEDVQVSVKINASKINEIDLFAQKMKVSRAHLVRKLIDAGLDDLRVMNNTGILSLAVRGIDLLEIIKSALSEKRYVLEDDKKLIIDL